MFFRMSNDCFLGIEAAQTLSEPQQLENATDESNASTTTSSRPVRFPGEEAETELYFEVSITCFLFERLLPHVLVFSV